jgi:hypothetical protein
MKSRLVLLVAVCLAVTANSQELWGGESQRSPAGVDALEGLGALGGASAAVAWVSHERFSPSS